MGDRDQAEQLAAHLRIFLICLAGNVEATQAIVRLGIPWIGMDNARLIVESIERKKSGKKGKTTKSGAELFAKFLAPNKPTKRKFEAIWLASVFELKKSGNRKSEFERIATFINLEIEKNNQILRNWNSGKRDDGNYNPSLPKRRITKDQLERAYREYKGFIQNKNDRANGVSRHRIKS